MIAAAGQLLNDFRFPASSCLMCVLYLPVPVLKQHAAHTLMHAIATFTRLSMTNVSKNTSAATAVKA